MGTTACSCHREAVVRFRGRFVACVCVVALERNCCCCCQRCCGESVTVRALGSYRLQVCLLNIVFKLFIICLLAPAVISTTWQE